MSLFVKVICQAFLGHFLLQKLKKKMKANSYLITRNFGDTKKLVNLAFILEIAKLKMHQNKVSLNLNHRC